MASASAPVDRPTGATNYAMNAVRIVAAFLVVISHIRPLFFVDYSQAASSGVVTQALYAVTSVGHQAVIVFFVLSGYWVGGSVTKGLGKGSFSLARYGIARVTRLWMVLLPAIVLTQTLDRLGLILFPHSDVYSGSEAYHTVIPAVGPAPTLDALTTLGNLFFLQGLHVASLGSNTALWSVAAEFWYYFLFPAALIAVWRGVPLLTRFVAIVLFVGGMLLISPPTQPEPTQVLALFPAWLLGALVAWQRSCINGVLQRISGRGLAAVRCVGLLALVVATIVDSRSHSLLTTYVLAVVASVFLASLVNDVQSQSAKNILGPLSWAAEWSYSLYATHLPVVAFMAAILMPQASMRWQMVPATFALLLCLAIAPIAVAMMLYSVSERHTNYVRARVLRFALRTRVSAN